MMWLKGCPRCQGDLTEELAVEPELQGMRFVSCLQCGYVLSADQEQALPRKRLEPVSSGALRRALGAVAKAG
jgi:hypothetical protein